MKRLYRHVVLLVMRATVGARIQRNSSSKHERASFRCRRECIFGDGLRWDAGCHDTLTRIQMIGSGRLVGFSLRNGTVAGHAEENCLAAEGQRCLQRGHLVKTGKK